MLRCFVGFGLVFAGLLWAAGCADQEEGQRCDPLNGDNDCAAGLVCVRADKLALVEVGAVCCPPAGEDENAVKECRAELQTSDGGNTVLPIDPDSGASTAMDAGGGAGTMAGAGGGAGTMGGAGGASTTDAGDDASL